MHEGTFTIKTEAFEGPLDLLLNLIEKRKLLINDIALAQVTDDYIAYIEQQGDNQSLGQTSHFILVASTLLLIKSKSLLPTLELTEEEQGDIADLELRLKIYKRIRDASEDVLQIFGKNKMFTKNYIQAEDEIVFAPSKQITLENITEVIQKVLNALPKTENVPKAIVKKVISLDEMMGRLTKRIQGSINMSFKEFSKSDSANKAEVKINVIVSFLAMLELVKQGSLRVRQDDRYTDIMMETNDVGLPHYG